MNRFKITEDGIRLAKEYLKGNLLKSKAPKFAVKHSSRMTVKNGKLYFENKEVISEERVDDVFRKSVYQKDSDIPLNRERLTCRRTCEVRLILLICLDMTIYG